MKEHHQIEIPSYKEIWKAVERQYEIEQEKHDKKKDNNETKEGNILEILETNPEEL